MNATLNKLIVVMSLFCVLLGFQNVGIVTASEMSIKPQPILFQPLLGELSSSAAKCSQGPLISKGKQESQTWLKAEWTGADCAQPDFVGWSVYDSEGDFVTGLEGGSILGHNFSIPGKYTVILSYSGLQGSGKLLMKKLELLEQVQFELEIQ